MEDPQVMRDRVQDAFTQASETYDNSPFFPIAARRLVELTGMQRQ
jgi:hypothetical protein